MARIRGRDTEPELILRRALWADGERYRVNYKTPAGRPDIVFPGRRVAVFVDGCFWHGCPDHYVPPRTRVEFWARKLRTNVERDRRQTLQLEECGWRVLRFWEHEVHTHLEGTVETVRAGSYSSRSRDRGDWRVVTVEPSAGERERRTLEALRGGDTQRVEVRTRSTKKW
jgi:DNA mismatch endonuclease (patch repair protein)